MKKLKLSKLLVVENFPKDKYGYSLRSSTAISEEIQQVAQQNIKHLEQIIKMTKLEELIPVLESFKRILILGEELDWVDETDPT